MSCQGEVPAGETSLLNGETSSFVSVTVGKHRGSSGSKTKLTLSSESLQAIGGSEDLSLRGTLPLVSSMTPTVMVGTTISHGCLQSLDNTA